MEYDRRLLNERRVIDAKVRLSVSKHLGSLNDPRYVPRHKCMRDEKPAQSIGTL
jgi:hypothetical protein